MGYLTCKFVRPDKQLFEGKCASMTLVTYSGELGVLPGHASEICALGDGVVRIKAANAFLNHALGDVPSQPVQVSKSEILFIYMEH